jgi:hypothetical protein
MTRSGLFLGVLVLTVSLVVGTASSANLVPHRAAYTIKLISATAKSGLTDIRGLMVLEWAESCDHWTVQQKARFEFVRAQGPVLQTETSFTSWESKDGRDYGFNLHSERGGQVIDDLRGKATVGGESGGGVATLTRPTATKIKLPKGTMFPTTHAALLIDRAAAGDRRLSRVVFLGQREDDPMEINAVISPVGAADRERAVAQLGETEKQQAGPLMQGRAWRTRIAFFAIQSDAVAPEFEVEEILYANGIAADVMVEYEDFSMIYSLERLEPLPKPTC